MTVVDRSGAQLRAVGEPLSQFFPRLSPDGTKAVISIVEGDPDLWIYDLEHGLKTRFTFDPTPERSGTWTPKGDQIAYGVMKNGNFDIYAKASTGTGEASLLVSTPVNEWPLDWSPDGKILLYQTATKESKGDLLYRERRSDGSLGEPVVFLKTPFDETAGQISPDGRFIAYTSDESGRYEVYVREFPSGAGKWQVSAKAGFGPRWRRDGKELYYVEQRRLMAVSVATRPGFSPGPPAALFEKRALAFLAPQAEYDVTPDGKRFVMVGRPPGEAPLAIHVVHNWFEEFRGQK
jgi:eukaryotic-like serine/threonine-protein kinase